MAKKPAPAQQPKSAAARPSKYPRQSVEKALRVPQAILDKNAGHACTRAEAAGFLGLKNEKGPFGVEIASAKK